MAIKWTTKDVTAAFEKAMRGNKGGAVQLLQQLKDKAIRLKRR